MGLGEIGGIGGGFALGTLFNLQKGLGAENISKVKQAGELQARQEEAATRIEQIALEEASARASGDANALRDLEVERVNLQEELATVTEQQAQLEEIGGLEGRAASETAAFEKAQEALGRTKDEVVSNIDASKLRQQGLITDADEAFITRLNETEEGALATIQQFRETQETGFGGLAQEITQDLTESGLLSREALSGAAGQAFRTLTGLTDQAVSALQPFAETGERANLQSRVLQGLATPEERQKFEAEFGGFQESPGFRFRQEEAERSQERRQRALGRVFSGTGQELLSRTSDRIAAEEFEAQVQRAQFAQQLGLGASTNIAQLRSQQGLAGAQLQAQTGVELARSILQQGRDIAGVRQVLGVAGLGAQQRLNEQQLALQSQIGLLGAQSAQQTQLGLAGAEREAGAQTTGALSQFGTAGAQLGLQGGLLAGQRQQEISGVRAQGQRQLGDIGLGAIGQRSQADINQLGTLGGIDISRILGIGALGSQLERRQGEFRARALRDESQLEEAEKNRQAQIAAAKAGAPQDTGGGILGLAGTILGGLKFG